MFNYAGKLRSALQKSARAYAGETGLPKDAMSQSAGGTLIFRPYATGTRHGNFYDPSYQSIIKREDWKMKLWKSHQRFPKDSGIKELDSSNSSDALLMNIFCDPALDREKLRHFFGVPPAFDFVFARKVPVRRQYSGYDTEIDLEFGDIYLEAKLTEADFTQREPVIVEAYDALRDVFDVQALPRATANDHYVSYQLIRNVLAAEQDGKRAWLLVDSRRPDLVRAWIAIMNAIKDPAVRKRCGICFWQELAEEIAAPELRDFLRLKYEL